jgi:catechol 2,3-dioxygenase-like lactoylglutathione lyase family enzyme
VTRDDFRALLDRAADGWANGDAAAVAVLFAEEVEYLDPFRYRFDRRADLLPFFEPPPGGHQVTWHQVVWDGEARTGVAEYTYEGQHRYHGAAVAHVDANGRIDHWREWQHLDDRYDWATRMRGPSVDIDPTDAAARPSIPAAIDHVQLGMPRGAEDDARAFYVGILGLREITKPPALAARGGAWFAGRSVAVHLGVEADFHPTSKAHPAFVVDELGTVRRRLAETGITVEDDDSGLPVARGYVRDPFGNRIELVDARDAGFSTRF